MVICESSNVTTTHVTLRAGVSKTQLELIRNKANYYGFSTMSAYIRDVALRDIYYLDMLKEIHEKICGKGE